MVGSVVVNCEQDTRSSISPTSWRVLARTRLLIHAVTAVELTT